MTRNSPWEPYVNRSLDPWGALCARSRELQINYSIEIARDWSSPRCAFAYNNWRAVCQDMDAFSLPPVGQWEHRAAEQLRWITVHDHPRIKSPAASPPRAAGHLADAGR
jgi:hypothetical protein